MALCNWIKGVSCDKNMYIYTCHRNFSRQALFRNNKLTEYLSYNVLLNRNLSLVNFNTRSFVDYWHGTKTKGTQEQENWL